MRDRAVFLDRDGTLVHARHFPSRPEELVLFDGIETELMALQEARFRLIVITNQSGIARGLFSLDDLLTMHRHLSTKLLERGVRLDAFYFCPHHPEGALPEFAFECECRKPAPGMLHSAADDLGIDLSKSWFVGDILDDIEAGNRAGCRTILVDQGTESPPVSPIKEPDHVAATTREALRLILACEGLIHDSVIAHVPAGWRQDERVLASARSSAGVGSIATLGSAEWRTQQ